MAAYLIGNYNITDPDAFKEYLKNSSPIMAGGGKLLVLERASDVREGDGGHQTVVIEYPDMDAAVAAYESEEYQAVVGLRHDTTENGRLVLVNGMG